MRRFAYGDWQALCCGLLAGCVRAYVQPAGAHPSAEIILASAGSTETNSFVAFEDNPCTSGNNDPAELGTLSILEDRTKRLYNTDQRLCLNVVSFVPQPGKRYELKQAQSAMSCETVVTDLDTMQPARGRPAPHHGIVQGPLMRKRPAVAIGAVAGGWLAGRNCSRLLSAAAEF